MRLLGRMLALCPCIRINVSYVLLILTPSLNHFCLRKSTCHSAGEAAVHLLGRMLAFDPGRRISAEEALCHEYFAALESSAVSELGKSLWLAVLSGDLVPFVQDASGCSLDVRALDVLSCLARGLIATTPSLS